MRVARVFLRKTAATPDDELAFVGLPPEQPPEVDGVHISVVFTYDKPKLGKCIEAWSKIAEVSVGGPAINGSRGLFLRGLYVKNGYTITSRGCPNNCWFCDVPKREGKTMMELPIVDGWNVLDSNLLACSMSHIKNVFEMLSRQHHPVEFTGGLEAARLTDDHVALLWNLRPAQMFFAYDTPDDLEPLIEAGKKLRYANFTRKHMRCYVLIGWPKDTFDRAQKRLLEAWDVGFMPMAMLWKNNNGDEDKEWRRFQRLWARPAATKQVVKSLWTDQLH
jgi:hypothetical protein